ncbi:MAG TPA: ABC transporter permease subunit [Thermoanaerobaculia bacterium]|nr:ABC transporter permease subunit [Thermoanaerobaculia bacterium]
MSALWATFNRELRAYFLSPLAYLVLIFFLFANGFIFSVIMSFLNDPRTPATARPMDTMFNTIFFWIILLFVCMVLTMRLLSEELRSGSIEVLMTAPITESQVVAGKYLAALAFFVALWLPTLVYAVIIAHYSKVDWGPIAGGYFGILCIGALFLSIGLFASSLTRSQLVAAIITFAMLMVVWAIGLLANLVNNETAKQVFGYVNLLDHMDEFAKGIVDSRRLVYYLSVIFFFLFLTSRALEDRKWR